MFERGICGTIERRMVNRKEGMNCQEAGDGNLYGL